MTDATAITTITTTIESRSVTGAVTDSTTTFGVVTPDALEVLAPGGEGRWRAPRGSRLAVEDGIIRIRSTVADPVSTIYVAHHGILVDETWVDERRRTLPFRPEIDVSRELIDVHSLLVEARMRLASGAPVDAKTLTEAQIAHAEATDLVRDLETLHAFGRLPRVDVNGRRVELPPSH